MIKFSIDIPDEVLHVQTPKMIYANYISCDPRLKLLDQDKFKGLCSIEINTETYLEQHMTSYVVKATYYNLQDEMVRKLTL